MSRYNFKENEAKWQRVWQERSCFEVAADPAAVEAFLRRTPVPCVQELAHNHGALTEFVRADLERRLAERG
jgi:valyl-tRNA synthetase